MSESGLVSFVVIAYNEAANIARTLAAINALDGLADREILVVDDGSRDGTARIVKEIATADPRVRLIELGENRGRGFARNEGITAAKGEFIATVDADIVLPADWLTRLRAAMSGHDGVGGTAVPDGDATYLHRRFRLSPRLVASSTIVTGNNGLYRREVFDVVRFDPALREGEDIALNHALRQHGFSLATVPGLLVTHQEDKSFATSVRWLFDSGRGATRQLLTYREIRQPDLVTGGFVAAATIGLVAAARGHRVAALAVPAGYVAAAGFGHVRSRFDLSASHWSAVAPAVAADSALLGAYFLGRLAGLTAARRRPARPR